jgi:uncharacterized protein (TIGR01777 family)
MEILITGGSGLIGKRLTVLLQKQGHQVSWLVRKPGMASVPAYRWSISDNYVDPAALRNADVLIHLAGENVGEGRWTASRKKQILESRISTTKLLVHALASQPNRIKTVICASAIGYYGDGTPEQKFDESSNCGSGFLAHVTEQWEEATKDLQQLNIRLVVLRIGVVLSKDGGAVQKLVQPIKWFAGAPIGSGRQIMSWIHIDDLCRLFIKASTDETMNGVYNAVAPNPVDNATMTRQMAKILNRPLLLPPVPAFALRFVLGEMSEMVLGGAWVSSEKVERAGFEFSYPEISIALQDVLR